VLLAAAALICWLTAPSEPGLAIRIDTFRFVGELWLASPLAAPVSVPTAVSVPEPGLSGAAATALAATPISWLTAPLSPGLAIRISTFTFAGPLWLAAALVAVGPGATGVGAAGAVGANATTGVRGELGSSARAGAGRASPRAESVPAAAAAHDMRSRGPMDRACSFAVDTHVILEEIPCVYCSYACG